MNHTQSLPEPSPDTLAHSESLIAVIRDEIEKSDSYSISFRRYMEMALYQTKLGYYVAGKHKIGPQGDFITAPEISPLFSKCIAKQCAEVLHDLNTSNEDAPASVLELGAGSGKMASEVLLELEQLGQLPQCYYILDVSPDLIQLQKETLQQHASHLQHLVKWVPHLPDNFLGVILGNEVLDAMPVEVFTQHNKDIFQHHVTWEDDKLVEQLKPAPQSLVDKVSRLKIKSDAPYTSEINPNLNAWLKSLNESLAQGLILLIDYGYIRKEYYLAERNKGTLICHYQHLVNDAPLHYPGLQDITANVDFTAVAEAADELKLEVSGFTSQVHFLANTGLDTYFMQALDEKSNDSIDDKQKLQHQLAQEVRKLSLPSEMGERFKCIALSKNLDLTKKTLLGFKNFDQRFRL